LAKSQRLIANSYSFTALNNASILAGGISGKIASWLGENTNPVGNMSFNSLTF